MVDASVLELQKGLTKKILKPGEGGEKPQES